MESLINAVESLLTIITVAVLTTISVQEIVRAIHKHLGLDKEQEKK